MAKNLLSVRLHGKHVGILEQTPTGKMIFSYDKNASEPISMCMPVRAEPYTELPSEAFFGGLLPENENVKKIIGKRFHVSPNNHFSLLKAIGYDCAGAISFHEIEEPEILDDSLKLTTKEIKDEELYQHIINLPKEPLFLGVKDLRLSLAGAHDKAAVCMIDNKILLPENRCPTTHILKPAIAEFPSAIENEYLCLKLAHLLGFSVPAVQMRRIKDVSFLLIERYDRAINGNHIKRIHQEDFCQALGIPSLKKYQNEGGPGFKDCFKLLNTTTYPIESRNAFSDIMLYNFLILNMDAHGKNFSLLYKEKAVLLAPFYDILCTVVYEALTKKMSMRIGKEYYFDRVFPRHWEQLCKDIHYSYPALKKSIQRIGESILKIVKFEKDKILEVPNATIDKIIALWETHITFVLEHI